MRKLLIAASVAALAGYGTVRWRASESAVTAAHAHDQRLVQDRIWVDHLPKHDRDRINVFAALTQRPGPGPRGPVGMFEKIGPWEGHFQAFRYEAHGEEMRILFPQTGDRETLRVKARACDEQRGMDYCLDVEGSSRGVKRYYSRRGWEVRTVDEAHDIAQQLVTAAP